MHLKGLKMQGFKSFADNIELTFSDGITAIVGPNGSGKSNISDAVRWVLGEQSAKTLRGSKMEDVIFNGTQTRKRLGFAEVTLRLDNRDRHFNMDFDEIAVTRKVFASGESQYFINDAACRLKDIHEIFMDTGLGRDGYSMVGQGKIDEILSNKSEDRREIFEEAAGISKYRYRKEEAERKLRHTDENLDRVADIIGELEIQIEPLTQQAEKAKKYLNLRDQLKTYDVNLALRAVERSRAQGTELSEKLEAALLSLQKAERELSNADSEQEACYIRFEELGKAMTEANEELRKAEENMVIGVREVEVLKNTIEGNLRLLERIEKETEDLATTKLAAESNIRAEEEKIEEHKKRIEAIGVEKESLSADMEGLDEGAGQHTEVIDKLQEEIAAAFEQISECKIKLSNLVLTEQNLKKRLAEQKEELKHQEKELKTQEERRESLDAEIERKTAFIAELEKQMAGYREAEKVLEEEHFAKQKELDEARLLLEQKSARLHLLTEMEQNFDGYHKSVKEVMKQAEGGMLSRAKIYGPVSKLIQVDKQYAQAIGAAIGGSLQNIVVGTEEDAKQAISCLKKTGAGRATFMPVSAVSGELMDASKLAKEDGFVGVAAELADYDTKFDGIIKNLIGRTAVFETVDQAISVSRKYKQSLRLVTLSGELFAPGGAISGGSQQKGSQLLGREQEISDLKQELIALKKRVDTLEKEANAIEKKVLDASEEFEKTDVVCRENKEVLLVLTRDKEHYSILLSGLTDALKNYESVISETEQEIAGLSGVQKEAEEGLSLAEQTIAEKRAKVNELEEDAEVFVNKKQKISDSLLQKGFEEAALFKEIEQARERINAIREDISRTDMNMNLRKKEAEEIQATNHAHKEEIAAKEQAGGVLSAEAEAKRKAISDITAERQAAEQRLKSLQGDANNSRETVFDLRREYDRLGAQKEKLETEAESALSRLWDEYEITFSEAETMRREDLGADTFLSRQISSLRSKIRELGNVNVDAIEELAAVSERYTFLTGQRDDLLKAKRDLVRIIDEMQTIMKKQFKEQFDKINQHFKSTFTELFGGGSADLQLTDEDNVLESGININVQPPGKKLQSLSLLSGGERALSAIALLFAILRLKPTPFCFLDEIEAALDENNVYRYAEFIKRFSRKTQFILVTHRRGTMECADMIYGVTMQEKGVSKLLELNLDEIEAKG